MVIEHSFMNKSYTAKIYIYIYIYKTVCEGMCACVCGSASVWVDIFHFQFKRLHIKPSRGGCS